MEGEKPLAIRRSQHPRLRQGSESGAVSAGEKGLLAPKIVEKRGSHNWKRNVFDYTLHTVRIEFKRFQRNLIDLKIRPKA